jgi:hypothetical protein
MTGSLLGQIGDLSSAGALWTVPVTMESRVGAESDWVWIKIQSYIVRYMAELGIRN